MGRAPVLARPLGTVAVRVLRPSPVVLREGSLVLAALEAQVAVPPVVENEHGLVLPTGGRVRALSVALAVG